MKWPRFTTVSIAINVALLGFVAYFFLQPSKPEPSENPPPQIPIANTVTQISVRRVFPSNFWNSLAANQIPTWSVLESTNYVTYIENLRAIGCPEETIKDIIIADIAKLYAKKRAALRAHVKPRPYWRADDLPLAAAEKNALGKELQALDLEQEALVKKLLGVDLRSELAKFSDANQSEEINYQFLPPEKRDKLVELQLQFEELEQNIYRQAKGVILDEDAERLKKLEKQKDEEMAKILSPEELEEYQLRNSSTASNMRSQLRSFESSEEEFRRIFRLQKTYDDQFANAFDSTDEKQIEIRAKAQDDAQQALNEEIKKILGDKRYVEYQRAQDPDYNSLVQLTERFESSRDVAAKVYDMKQEAERAKSVLEANSNLTDEARVAALAALAKETQRSIAQSLGGTDSKLWKTYQKNGGQWIDDLKNTEITPPVPEVIPAPTFTPPVPLPPPLPPFIPPR